MSNTNRYLAAEAATMEQPLDFAGAADNKARVRLLRDAIEKEGTDPTDHRFYLDEMSPVARLTLFKMLTDMEAAVTV